MDDLTPPSGLWSGLGVAVAGIVGGAFWLIQKISNSSVDRAGDRAEVSIIEVLQGERDKWQELYTAAEAEKRQYFQQFMEASTQVALLTEKVTVLTEQVEALKSEVVRLKQAMENSR